MNDDLQTAVNDLDCTEFAVRAIGSLALNDAQSNTVCQQLLAEELHCLMAVVARDIKHTRERLEAMLAALP